MIKLTFDDLDQTWLALRKMAAQPLPRGAYRLNLLRIMEDCQPQVVSFAEEMRAIVAKHCKEIAPNDYESPKDPKAKALFEADKRALYEMTLEVRGEKIDMEDFEESGAELSVEEIILLKRWLLVESEFPAALPEQSPAS